MPRAQEKKRDSSSKAERLEARINAPLKRMIERAAELRGTTLSDFVISSAQEAAAATLREFEVLKIQDEAREVFISALLHPPAPNEAARAAAERYAKSLER